MSAHRPVDGAKARDAVAVVVPHPYVDALACFREPIAALAAGGWHVDLFTRLSPLHPVPFFGTPHVHVRPFEMSRAGAVALVHALATRRPKYRWLVTVPQWGLHYAGAAAKMAGIPMACISDELFPEREAKGDEGRRWKRRERRAHQRCRFTIALSDKRAAFIREENGLGADHPIFVVPNAAAGPASRARSRYYHDVLRLPDTTRVVLHAGSLWWQTAQDVVQTSAAWPADSVVVFQGRIATQADSNGWHDRRVVRFANTVLPATLLDHATASAAVGLALYDTARENNRLMGTASGKVSLYLKNGLPVIATAGSDLEWIEREQCGVCVASPDEVPGAVTRVFRDYERLSANAVRCFDRMLDFARHFAPVSAAMARG